MNLLPVADGARLLGIHPKTLHHWLKEANLPLVTHPTDARIKCVTEEHLHQVACLHDRPLQSLAVGCSLSSSRPVSGTSPPCACKRRGTCFHCLFVAHPHVSEADLIQKLACLETRVVTLQEQITQLALALLQERERSVEHRLTSLESLLQPLVERQISAPPTPEVEQEPPCPLRGPQTSPSRRTTCSVSHASSDRIQRAGNLRDHQFPGGRGAAETRFASWFDWLATLSSFRFVGPTGRFTAHRGYKQGQQTRFWSASRCVRRHTYKHYLGVTESLTIASLEHIAADSNLTRTRARFSRFSTLVTSSGSQQVRL